MGSRQGSELVSGLSALMVLHVERGTEKRRKQYHFHQLQHHDQRLSLTLLHTYMAFAAHKSTDHGSVELPATRRVYSQFQEQG
jgi:hypothetical protein